MKHPLYLAYGALLLGLSGWAQFRGWSFSGVNEVKQVPKSVRDNPAAYRSHYVPYRYFGGK
ncbi:MAG: hypothetical protein ACRD44_03915 [Bryobacteraceae bacterium]